MANLPFGENPLFRNASAQMKALARREFNRSAIGQVYGAVRSAGKDPAGTKRAAAAIKSFAKKYTRGSPAKIGMELLRGTELGSLAGAIEKYSKGGTGSGGVSYELLKDFLGSLGPAGKLLGSLLSPQAKAGFGSGLKGELSAAMNFLSAFAGDDEAYEVARRIVEGRGGRVIDPADIRGGGRVRRSTDVGTEAEASGGAGGKQAAAPPSPRGRQRSTVDVPMGNGSTRAFPKSHPIVTGDMQTTPDSSNVHSFGYDVDNWFLYVRFKAAAQRGQKERPQAPGSLYQYANVPPKVFLGMLRASSKGTYIWDNIRIRGTYSGHRFDYTLVGISGNYVPRKATLSAEGEVFLRREVRTLGGNTLRSSRPNQLVRPLVSTGAPNRGNNGRPPPPNRGRPRRT